MYTRIILGFLCLCIGTFLAPAQVAINTDGSPPDSSAMLDVQSVDKGVLIPRIDFDDRPQPAPNGLLIYVTQNGPYGDSALYYFDSNNWKKFTNYKYSLGQRIGGGTIFWLDDSGEHGLIAAAGDSYLFNGPWGCYGITLGANHVEVLTGDLNTSIIVENCSSSNAAEFCNNLLYHGLDDWYMPSRDELIEMQNHKELLEPWNWGPDDCPVYYWSSSEINSTRAYVINMCDGLVLDDNKFISGEVRCIRKF